MATARFLLMAVTGGYTGGFFGEVDVSVGGAPPTSNYASWADTHGVTGGPNGDSNHDGMQNGIAYFMNATGIATNPGITGNTVTWTNGGNIPSSTYGTQFVVRTSANLVDWMPVPNDGSAANLSNTAGSVSCNLPSGAVGGKSFVSLMVTPN